MRFEPDELPLEALAPLSETVVIAESTEPRGLPHDGIEEFCRDLHRAFSDESAGSGVTVEEAFFENMAGRLEAAGEIETFERTFYEGSVKNKSLKIDGNGGDPRDSDGVLSVIVCDFYTTESPTIINAQHARRMFGQLANFVLSAKGAEFREKLGMASCSGIAHTIADGWEAITKIKLILITNAIYSSRTDSVPAGALDGIPTTYNIWDLSRFYRFEASGQAREDLVIDFRREYGPAIPALVASRNGNDLESYLAVIPGSQLAEIYDKWGSRLLESNVRSFLQAKGKVNQSIRDTIKTEPEMFFSYNNGLAVTAEHVETELVSGELRIVSATNLQIVNGGQTTATIHAAKRLFSDSLANVHVQMKLTVVPSQRSAQVVPKISEYANSQNKVSVADFFSNHPFHIRIEEYSRRLLAPAVEGLNRETKWFYERARGQYLVERANRSDAERRRFDSDFPKSQFFAKTDLAKVELSFRGKPDSVSKGAQKNFGEFSKEIGTTWTKSEAGIDETWFRRLIARLIVFRHLESIIPRQEWYPGGYRANIVTYAIAKLQTDVHDMKLVIDFDKIWREQSVSTDLEDGLLMTAKTCAEVITQPVIGIKNISEWAKKQACWANVQSRKIAYNSTLKSALLEPEEAKLAEKEGRREAALLSGIEAQSKVVSEGNEFWIRLRKWGNANARLSLKEDGVLQACSSLPSRLPTEKQCSLALEVLTRSLAEGYQDNHDAPRVKISAWNRQY